MFKKTLMKLVTSIFSWEVIISLLLEIAQKLLTQWLAEETFSK
jgi:hypothetical protein